MPKIKILLATYNGERYIEDQIQTILNQESVDLDLLIQDDNSTDNTVNRIKDKFPKINIKQNRPGTGTAAKNFLKMLCELNFEENFEYVAFADQDDIWHSKKMSQAISLLKKENASLYCSNLTKWDIATNKKSLLKKSYMQQKFDYLFEGGSAGCTYLFTKELALDLKKILEKKSVLSQKKSFSHDWFVYFLARSRNYKVVIDDNSYIDYRLHSSNVHGHLNKLSWSTIKNKFSKVLNNYYENNAKIFICFLDHENESYIIYKKFLRGYFSRNRVIWKYNTQLMRDRKKFLVFAFLNLIKIN